MVCERNEPSAEDVAEDLAEDSSCGQQLRTRECEIVHLHLKARVPYNHLAWADTNQI